MIQTNDTNNVKFYPKREMEKKSLRFLRQVIGLILLCQKIILIINYNNKEQNNKKTNNSIFKCVIRIQKYKKQHGSFNLQNPNIKMIKEKHWYLINLKLRRIFTLPLRDLLTIYLQNYPKLLKVIKGGRVAVIPSLLSQTLKEKRQKQVDVN